MEKCHAYVVLPSTEPDSLLQSYGFHMLKINEHHYQVSFNIRGIKRSSLYHSYICLSQAEMTEIWIQHDWTNFLTLQTSAVLNVATKNYKE